MIEWTLTANKKPPRHTPLLLFLYIYDTPVICYEDWRVVVELADIQAWCRMNPPEGAKK